jgi:hypothetical protein
VRRIASFARSSPLNEFTDAMDRTSAPEIGLTEGFRGDIVDDSPVASPVRAPRNGTRLEPVNTASELFPKSFGLKLAAASYAEA